MRAINNLPLAGANLRTVKEVAQNNEAKGSYMNQRPNQNMGVQNRNASAQEGGYPVIPLPNPGEGGPVYPGSGWENGNIPDMEEIPGNGSNNNDSMGNGNQEVYPVIPLPNPGEGGPVYPGSGWENGNIPDMPGNGNQEVYPVIPLPNPGEGGPVYPGNGSGNQGTIIPTIPGTIIITYPRPNENCSFCNPGSNRNGKLRMLNATTGYNAFWVYINDKLLINNFGFADVTEYVDVAAGEPVITLRGENGYIYLQQPIKVESGATLTIAIVNTASGLGLKVISDENCDRIRRASCVRVGNLSYNSGPLNLVIGNRYVSFRNVNSGEVTDFATIWPGEYSYTVSRTNNTMYPIWGSTTLLQSVLYLQQDKNYTIYLFQYNPSADAIKAVIVED